MAHHFRHFADQLYCSGSERRWCVPMAAAAASNHLAHSHPGECYWHKTDGRLVTHDDMDQDKRPRHAWQSDVWDAAKAGGVDVTAFPHVSKADATACVHGKHVLVLGESTTRDLYYEFAQTVGLKPDRSPCMNVNARAPICTRAALSADNRTRVSFQFLSRANATRELAITKATVAERAPDAVFVYCVMYDWMSTVWDGESDAMGDACMQNVDEAILVAWPRTPVYLLGPTFPPNWVDAYPNRTLLGSRMSRIFNSINHAAGLECATKPDGDFKVVSSRGIRGPIDRYNVVGHRKRDMVHPYENAHRPVVQMMLTHLCGAGGAGGFAGLHHSDGGGGAQAAAVRGRSFG